MEFIMKKKFVKIDVFNTPNLLLTDQTFFPYAHNRFRRIKFLAILLFLRRLSENEIFFPRSRKAKIITTGIH